MRLSKLTLVCILIIVLFGCSEATSNTTKTEEVKMQWEKEIQGLWKGERDGTHTHYVFISNDTFYSMHTSSIPTRDSFTERFKVSTNYEEVSYDEISETITYGTELLVLVSSIDEMSGSEGKKDKPIVSNSSASGDGSVDDITVIVVMKKVVTDNLKSPSSAKFSNISIQNNRSGKYNVTGYVEAENSFGTTVNSKFSVDLIIYHDESFTYNNLSIY